MINEKQVQVGTAGGTLLSMVLSLGADMLHTALIAATGATVSFMVSMLLQWIWKRMCPKKGTYKQ
jgi:hypothetical protein